MDGQVDGGRPGDISKSLYLIFNFSKLIGV